MTTLPVLSASVFDQTLDIEVHLLKKVRCCLLRNDQSKLLNLLIGCLCTSDELAWKGSCKTFVLIYDMVIRREKLIQKGQHKMLYCCICMHYLDPFLNARVFLHRVVCSVCLILQRLSRWLGNVWFENRRGTPCIFIA